MAGRTDAQPSACPASIRRSGRGRARRRFPARGAGERGAALVEAALVMPLLLLVVFGIIEFGTTYSNFIGLRDGVRQSARMGAVGTFGDDTSCSLTGASGASTNIRELMCLTKNEVGLDAGELRIKVLSADPTFTADGTFAKNDALIICAQIPTKSITGFLGSALAGKTLRTKVAVRIEQSDIVATAGEETPPSGENWSWCGYEALSL